MNFLKKSITLVLAICLLLCVVGCAEMYEPYDNFNPAGVVIVDCINGNQYETDIDDADFANKLLAEYKKLNIDTTAQGELGGAYLYMEFYNKDKTTLLVFTIYDNGSCCLGREYEELYTVTDGRQAYIKLCEMYESHCAE